MWTIVSICIPCWKTGAELWQVLESGTPGPPPQWLGHLHNSPLWGFFRHLPRIQAFLNLKGSWTWHDEWQNVWSPSNWPSNLVNCEGLFVWLYVVPVPMNITLCNFPSTASTVSTTILENVVPLFRTSGPDVSSGIASTMRGRSCANSNVLSGSLWELSIPMSLATLLIHFKKPQQFNIQVWTTTE